MRCGARSSAAAVTTRGNSASARSSWPSISWVSSVGSNESCGSDMPRSAAFSIIRQVRAWAYCT